MCVTVEACPVTKLYHITIPILLLMDTHLCTLATKFPKGIQLHVQAVFTDTLYLCLHLLNDFKEIMVYKNRNLYFHNFTLY